MSDKWNKNVKSKITSQKSTFHARNKHQGFYDFVELTKVCPDLSRFVFVNDYQNTTIDFANADAVKLLNKALLKLYYGLEFWDIPNSYLCPPIPGRADYIHAMADFLAEMNGGVIPIGKSVSVLDIGVGANCIFPIIGSFEYGWQFVGADIDAVAINSAKQIIENNPQLSDLVELRFQKSPSSIFSNIILPNDHFDFCMCNPPFHASKAEAEDANIRKISNLNRQKSAKTALNFGGQNGELYCKGGELEFIKSMISESVKFKNQCTYFSSLVAKSDHLKPIYNTLNYFEAKVKTIEMALGNKRSRIVVWGF